MKTKILSIIILAGLFITSTITPAAAQIIPVTAESNRTVDNVPMKSRSLDFANFSTFVKTVTASQQGSQYVGIVSPNHFSLPINQQPAGQPGFVSNEPEIVTEFSLARQFGTTGLLAHNHLAGAEFFELSEEDYIVLITADNEYEYFQVVDIASFQALQPNSPYSNFVDLEDTNRVLTAEDLFMEVYTDQGSLVIQTCIAQDNEPSWGRLFVKAEPVSITIDQLINFQSPVLQYIQ